MNEQCPLSERELEIVQLLATGATNQQIAQQLVISVNTVKVHLRNIYAKLDVSSRTEATMVAVRAGWVSVPGAEKEEQAPAEPEPRPAPSPLPDLGRWPPVSVPKRVALATAIIIALLFAFLPPVLQSEEDIADPFGGVFPTEAIGATSGRWHTRAQMPTPRTDLAVVAYDGLVYAIGGVSNDGVTAKVETYDPQTDTWTTRHPKPTPVGFISAAVIEGKIYVPGGISADLAPQTVLEVYDPATDTWAQRAPLPLPLGAYGLAVLGGKLYLFGGNDGEQYVDSVLVYDPETDTWEKATSMDQARGFLSVAAVEDRLYVAGGYDGTTEFRRLDAYNPTTDTWVTLSPMEVGRGGLALVPVRQRLYAIGGGMTEYLAFNETYDIRLDAWQRIETPLSGQWRGLGAAFVYPYIYAIGGWHEGPLSANEAYQALFIVIP